MKSIFVEIEKCLGCKSCELACRVAHSSSRLLHRAVSEEPPPSARISVVATHFGPLPLQCHHCVDAPCLEACIAGAIGRDETTGVVTVQEERCVGCWSCIMVCPFGAVASGREARVAYKCDACPNDEEAACVAGCPTGALVYCESGELVSKKRRERAETEPAARRAKHGGVLRGDQSRVGYR